MIFNYSSDLLIKHFDKLYRQPRIQAQGENASARARPRGYLGRTRRMKLHAENEINMAATYLYQLHWLAHVNGKIVKVQPSIERPVDNAVLLGKILCPNDNHFIALSG